MRLVFDQNAFDDLAWWMNTDSKKARRIISLIQETGKRRVAEDSHAP